MYSLELREQIARYLSTEITLEQLEDWTVRHLPQIAADPQSDDSSLAAAIDLCLAEYSEGLRSEVDIRRYLRDALDEFKTVFLFRPGNQTITYSGSSASNTVQASSSVGTNEFSTQLWSKSGYTVLVME